MKPLSTDEDSTPKGAWLRSRDQILCANTSRCQYQCKWLTGKTRLRNDL